MIRVKYVTKAFYTTDDIIYLTFKTREDFLRFINTSKRPVFLLEYNEVILWDSIQPL